jgi:hypothetical protein
MKDAGIGKIRMKRRRNWKGQAITFLRRCLGKGSTALAKEKLSMLTTFPYIERS